ncbi:ABC transporter ATP-binding protein [Olsenella urininfantis]|uniref:ABC transporter ATP-binding protein n=1 Tax=Olsenella urininfantis TaxID=1871033 RepID=UPI0009878B0B|nr:ABC transporter ATP-binding protein [Olsenella urininfantis]
MARCMESSVGTLDLSGEPSDLRVRGLAKSFDGFALKDVSFGVPRGSVVGLVGQNGAGKTTIMRGILGELAFDGGEVELFGQRLSGLDDAALRAVKSRVGFVSSVCAYPGEMSVAQVATMHYLAYPQFDHQLFEELAERMGLLPHDPRPHLSHAARKLVKDLSRGMGMKLQLACALACGASLLVMDEPTAGLDPIVREEVLDIIREYLEPGDKSVLISSHITSDLEHLADYVMMVDAGELLFSCEVSRIEDEMGLAQLRAAELEQVLRADERGFGPLRALRRSGVTALLVADRHAFGRQFPDYVCDPADIDDVMTLMVKGEVI